MLCLDEYAFIFHLCLDSVFCKRVNGTSEFNFSQNGPFPTFEKNAALCTRRKRARQDVDGVAFRFVTFVRTVPEGRFHTKQNVAATNTTTVLLDFYLGSFLFFVFCFCLFFTILSQKISIPLLLLVQTVILVLSIYRHGFRLRARTRLYTCTYIYLYIV